jgi:glucose 1-dehydrogenase
MQRLDGKAILVTGGSRGIGAAVARRCAHEGARIAILHHADPAEAAATVAAIAAAGGARGHAFEVDLADPGATAMAFASALRALGHLDVLINNAGIQIGPRSGDDFDDAAFDRVLAVNLRAATQLCALAIAQFLSRPGGGAIVNTTSVHEMVPKPGFVSYAASKAALGMLTRTLALEYADRGIRVNAVGPGAVDTSMNDGWRHDPTKRAAIASHIPMRRTATPDEIAGAYAFLASDDAAYVTGQTLYACGGLTLHTDFRNNWSS